MKQTIATMCLVAVTEAIYLKDPSQAYQDKVLAETKETMDSMLVPWFNYDTSEAKVEAQRVDDEEAKAERLRLEEEAEAERLRLEQEAEAELIRLEQEAEAERIRLENEAQAELLRLEEVAEAKRLRLEEEAKAELIRLENEAEAERQRLERIESRRSLLQPECLNPDSDWMVKSLKWPAVRYSHDKRSWKEANERCAWDNGYLYVPHSAEENQILWGKQHQYDWDQAWIGIRQDFVSYRWYTADKSCYDYKYFKYDYLEEEGQVANYADCAYLDPENNASTWLTGDCDARRSYFCKGINY